MESRAARLMSCVAVAAAAVTLGAAFVLPLGPVVLGGVPLQVLGLVTVVLLGSALLLPTGRRGRVVLVGLSGVPVVAIVVGVVLVVLAQESAVRAWGVAPAIMLGLLGTAILAPSALGRTGREVVAVVVGLVASITLLVHLVAVPGSSLSSVAGTLSAPVALLAGLLALATLLEVPQGTLPWASSASDPGAVLVRRVMPLALLGVPAAGVVRRSLEANGLEPGTATTIMTSVITVVLGALVLGTGLKLRAVDRERVQADEELRTLLRDLDDRVRRRAASREQRSVRLAVSSDRERIARDLHDRVIQRIFAAGLRLDSVAREHERVAPSVDEVVGQLDLAIQELRQSIQALTADDGAGWDLVHAEVLDAAAVLTTPPVVITPDRADDVAPEVLSEAAVVVRELLSNVARHARSRETVVVVELLDGDVVLSVSDDGVGMPEHAARRSGIANVRTRALSLGGDAVWSRRPEGGTTVVWRVPAVRPSDEAWVQGLG